MAATDYIRKRVFPHIWCPGCGHGEVMNGMLRAIESLGLSKDEIALVSGIGCSSRVVGYLDFYTMHTLHGRALGFATGVKLARPSLNVIVPMGDGDATAIGGNHFIHACRRNINITAIVMNNRIYGMTGGQFSPLSGRNIKATTAPYGTIDRDFDLVKLAMAAGATFVARTTAFHVTQMSDIIAKAITHKGFSVVEVLSQCPTYFGRKNKQGDAVEMLKWYRDNTVPVGSDKLQENPHLIERGIFVEREEPEYVEMYDQLIAQAGKGK